MPTLNLEASKKVYELLGWLDVEKHFGKHRGSNKVHPTDPMSHSCRRDGCIPLPNLGELIRLLPKIGEKKGWEFEEFFGRVTIAKVRIVAYHLANYYLEAPSPEEGMEEVSKYLLSII